jgi:hypothetical protein
LRCSYDQLSLLDVDPLRGRLEPEVQSTVLEIFARAVREVSPTTCYQDLSRATQRSTTTTAATSATASGTCAKPSEQTQARATSSARRYETCCRRSPRSLKPPGNGAAEAALGITEADLRGFALDGLTGRLDIIGVPINTL